MPKGAVRALQCRECGSNYPPRKMAVCEDCFAPVEVVYDLEAVGLHRSSFDGRPRSLWRYAELLPIKNPAAIVDLQTGWTPLVHCENLGRRLGLRKLYIKNDTVTPTHSFKDRPATVAVSKAVEFGDRLVGCASTGNLAAAVAAHAAKAGLSCYVFVPADLEPNKTLQITSYGARIIGVKGPYDAANRLAVQASEELGWNLVNVTTRPYYVEGSKTLAFEVCEQLNWNVPDFVVVASASGALYCATWRGFKQFEELDFVKGRPHLIAAQAQGCSPIADAFAARREDVDPISEPKTIAKSIAIGDPGDGRYALRTARESGGFVGAVSDEEIREAIRLLAEAEGIFAEPAGAVPIALTKKLAEEGRIGRDDTVVCFVTGSGFKGLETALEPTPFPIVEPTITSLHNLLAQEKAG